MGPHRETCRELSGKYQSQSQEVFWPRWPRNSQPPQWGPRSRSLSKSLSFSWGYAKDAESALTGLFWASGRTCDSLERRRRVLEFIWQVSHYSLVISYVTWHIRLRLRVMTLSASPDYWDAPMGWCMKITGHGARHLINMIRTNMTEYLLSVGHCFKCFTWSTNWPFTITL